MVSRSANLCLFIRVGISVYVSVRSRSRLRIKLFETPWETFNPDNIITKSQPSENRNSKHVTEFERTVQSISGAVQHLGLISLQLINDYACPPIPRETDIVVGLFDYIKLCSSVLVLMQSCCARNLKHPSQSPENQYQSLPRAAPLGKKCLLRDCGQ